MKSINLLQMNILEECSYSLFFLQKKYRPSHDLNIQWCKNIPLQVFTIIALHLIVCRSLIFIDRYGKKFSICESQLPFSIFYL